MEARWHKNRIKNRCLLRKADFANTIKKQKEFAMIFYVFGVEVSTKNPSKINQKLKLKMDRLLASIFGGFWWIFGSKLGGKTEPRSIQKASKKRWKIGGTPMAT